MADILVVDDDRDICRMLETLLGRSGHNHFVAHILADALQLAERVEFDIVELTMHCISRLCDRMKVDLKRVSSDFIEALASYDWPGNVRELFQTMEEVFANGTHARILFPHHLPERIRISRTRGYLTSKKREPAEDLLRWRLAKDKFEAGYIDRLMHAAQISTRKAFDISGISKARLYQLLGKYDRLRSRRTPSPSP